MSALRISGNISVRDDEIAITAIRAQGAGGQNVNKVSTAIHLRFSILKSSLPDVYKQRLMAMKDHRITADGTIIIKAQRYRTQEKNREDALQRLQALIHSANVTQKKRIATKPTRASQRRRLDSKTKHSRQKSLRGKVL